MAAVHPSAVVDPKARLEGDVSVGPYCVVGPQVRIGAGTVLYSHVVVEGDTAIGKRCRIFPFAAIGTVPQDKKYKGEPVRLEIGDDNVIREYVTVQPGTGNGGGLTRVGNRNWFLAGSHIAHDCFVEDDTVFANQAALAGHIHVESGAILGGLSGVHQFCRVGALAMISGAAAVHQDIPPFGMVQGDPARLIGINRVGMERAGLPAEEIRAVDHAYRLLFRSGKLLGEAAKEARETYSASPSVLKVLDFIAASQRGVCRFVRSSE